MRIANHRSNDTDQIELQMMPMMETKPYKHFEQTYQIHEIHFYISDAIKAPHEYIDMIHRIQTASEHDSVIIHLNSPGGQLDTGVQLINAIRNSQATVTTCIESEAHSMAALLFLAGDELVVNDNCMMMFHNFSGGTVGKGNEAFASIDAHLKWYGKLTKELSEHFLTEEEVERVMRGEDLWMQTEEIRERAEAMAEARMAEYEAMKAEMEVEMAEALAELEDIEEEEEKETKPKKRKVKKANKEQVEE